MMTEVLTTSEIEMACIQVGNHSITFVDTTKAWQELFKSMQYKINAGTYSVNGNDLDTFTDEKSATVKEKALPEHALYMQKYSPPRKESTCFICKKSVEAADMKNKVDCRVCKGLFHLKCVRNNGLCNDMICMRFDRSVGWSCNECDNVFGLLRDEEQDEISDLYDNIAGEDKVIDIEEYIDQRKKEYRELVDAEMTSARLEQEKEMFYAIDQDNSGYIDRWEFYPYMAIRYLSRRKSLEIIDMLTPHEVDNFRGYFRQMDPNNKGSITQSDARRAYVKWYLSNVRSGEDKYVDYTWYGGPKENTLLMRLKSKMAVANSFENVIEEQEIMITWEQFLRICALHVLSARVNTVSKRPKIPPMPIYLYSQSACLCYLEENF